MLTLRSYCCSGIEHTHMKKQRKNKVVMVSNMTMQHKVEYIRTIKLEVYVLMWRLLSEQSSQQTTSTHSAPADVALPGSFSATLREKFFWE